jgi:hypothetical protein
MNEKIPTDKLIFAIGFAVIAGLAIGMGLQLAKRIIPDKKTIKETVSNFGGSYANKEKEAMPYKVTRVENKHIPYGQK